MDGECRDRVQRRSAFSMIASHATHRRMQTGLRDDCSLNPVGLNLFLCRSLRSYDPVHIVVSACGAKYTSQAMTSILSLHHASKTYNFQCVVHILHEPDGASTQMQRVLAAAADNNITALKFDFVQVDPSKERHMFKPCATLRLLMASLLPRLDLVVYMDADVYIDDDLRELMATSSRFSSRQWAALAYETYAGKSWYTKGLTHGAFVKPFGINSGVMVASLARWRRSGFDAFWTSYVGHAPLGDQDVLNAYFARYPDELQILPCKWNWRIDSGCPNPITPARNGIWHGNRETFLKNKSAEYIRDYGVGSAEFDRVKQMASAFLSLGRFENFASQRFSQQAGASGNSQQG